MIDVVRASGWTAALLLVATLAATPIARALRSSEAAARVRKARRWAGIASAAAALVHGGLAVPTYLGWPGYLEWRTSTGHPSDLVAGSASPEWSTGFAGYAWWSEIAAAITSVPWLRSGALAAALLLPLLVTSFPSAVRTLRVRLWKPLHRLSYAVAALVVHHVLFAPYAPRPWGLALAGVFVGLAIARTRRPRRRRGAAPAEPG